MVDLTDCLISVSTHLWSAPIYWQFVPKTSGVQNVLFTLCARSPFIYLRCNDSKFFKVLLPQNVFIYLDETDYLKIFRILFLSAVLLYFCFFGHYHKIMMVLFVLLIIIIIIIIAVDIDSNNVFCVHFSGEVYSKTYSSMIAKKSYFKP